MRIKRRKSPINKRIILACTLAVLVCLGVGLAAHSMKLWPFSSKGHQGSDTVNYSPPTKEQSSAAGVDKQKSDESEGSDRPANSTPQSQAPTGSESNKASVNMTISALNQVSTTLYIRTLIQTLSSGGTCSLTIAGPNATSYTAQANTQAGPSTSTCQGFNVPTSALPPGLWHITVSFESSDTQATASRDITIQ